MYLPVSTRDPAAVRREVLTAAEAMFPRCDRAFIEQGFAWVTDCFAGKYPGYQAIDAHYHDFEHTLQGTLCMMRLLRARYKSGARPEVDQRTFQLGLMAILMHDTGYLKTRGDVEGTGAKYTITHVDRSADFAGQLLREKGFKPAEISAVQNMIRCTGVDANVQAIPFASEIERITGFALATGDLLGQMAAHDYVEKLPVLFGEFAEAARFSHNRSHFIASFADPSDLMRRTPEFWSGYVLKKLDGDFLGLYRYLNQPYPDGPNHYIQLVEENIEKLRRSGDAAVTAGVA
jgi:hypothetical protein